MIHYIENELLRVGIKEFGAELTSIINKQNKREYLWQGSPDVWSGQSPVLFPIIGRLKNDTYFLDGKSYSMPKHGLARKRPFKVFEKDSDSITFIQTEDCDTIKSYPFAYELKLRFTLSDNRLIAEHIVNNTNENKMYFSLGAHPAFNCKIGDIIKFEMKETLSTQMLDLKESLRLAEREPVLDNSDTIKITEHLFDADALIFDGIASKWIDLQCDGGHYPVRFFFSSPYLGIWAKPGADYVCLEPWYGVNDTFDSDGIFEKKEGIISLDAGESFSASWTAEIL